jgi:hypothetical protein
MQRRRALTIIFSTAVFLAIVGLIVARTLPIRAVPSDQIKVQWRGKPVFIKQTPH